jgi:hypothetical protein
VKQCETWLRPSSRRADQRLPVPFLHFYILAPHDNDTAVGLATGLYADGVRQVGCDNIHAKGLKYKMSEAAGLAAPRAPTIGKRSADPAQIPIFSSRPPVAQAKKAEPDGDESEESSSIGHVILDEDDDESSESLARRTARRLEYEERTSALAAIAAWVGTRPLVGPKVTTLDAAACSSDDEYVEDSIDSFVGAARERMLRNPVVHQESVWASLLRIRACQPSGGFVRTEDELAFRKWFAAALLPRAAGSDSCRRCLEIIQSCKSDTNMTVDDVLLFVEKFQECWRRSITVCAPEQRRVVSSSAAQGPARYDFTLAFTCVEYSPC